VVRAFEIVVHYLFVKGKFRLVFKMVPFLILLAKAQVRVLIEMWHRVALVVLNLHSGLCELYGIRSLVAQVYTPPEPFVISVMGYSEFCFRLPSIQ
jgi:cytochrome c oxidase subunit IV